MTPAKRTLGLLITLAGVLLLAVSPVLGAITLAIGVVMLIIPKNVYHVTLGSSSGETSALSSKDVEYVEQLVRAMNEAFIKRG